MIILNERAALSVKGAHRQGREIRMPCPVHVGGRDTLAIRQKGNGVVWHCFAGCDGKDIQERLEVLGIIEVQKDDWKMQSEIDRLAKKRKWCAETWNNATDKYDDRVAKWFEGRKISEEAWRSAFITGMVRQLDNCLVSKVTNNVLAGTGIHITNMGTKVRRSHGSIKGGAIRLCSLTPAQTVTGVHVICLAEGIETAIAYSQLSSKPCWSLISATGIANFELDENVPQGTRIIVAADFDGAGISACEALVRKNPGWEIDMVLPENYGTDWNDCLMEHSI